MDQEYEELDLQNDSNSVFDNFANKVEEHPKEAILVFLGTSITFGIANFYQWIKNKKEQKRHEEVENLQKNAIQKHDAEIRTMDDVLDENERLKKLIDSSLCDAPAEASDGGELDHEK